MPGSILDDSNGLLLSTRFAPVTDAISTGIFDPQGANSTSFLHNVDFNSATVGGTRPAAAVPNLGVSTDGLSIPSLPSPNGPGSGGFGAPGQAATDAVSGFWKSLQDHLGQIVVILVGLIFIAAGLYTLKSPEIIEKVKP